jgi:hypothetical protein
MARTKLSNKQSIAVLIFLGAIPGYLVFGDAITQWTITQWSKTFWAAKVKGDAPHEPPPAGNHRVEQKGNVSTTFIEKVPPRFIAAPQYNELVVAAKIAKQAIDPEGAIHWLTANQSVRAIRAQMEVAKVTAQKTEYLLKTAQHQAQINTLAASMSPEKPKSPRMTDMTKLGDNSHTRQRQTDILNTGTQPAAPTQTHALMDLRIKAYSGSTAYQPSFITLQIGDETFWNVTKGQTIANQFSLVSFDDETHCVLIKDRQEKRINACYH